MNACIDLSVKGERPRDRERERERAREVKSMEGPWTSLMYRSVESSFFRESMI